MDHADGLAPANVEKVIAMDEDWQPIESAPLDKNVLLWWRPRTDERYPKPPEYASELSNNRYAEACVIGQVSSHNPGHWWNGQRAELQDIWHVTHWQPLPKAPWSDDRTVIPPSA